MPENEKKYIVNSKARVQQRSLFITLCLYRIHVLEFHTSYYYYIGFDSNMWHHLWSRGNVERTGG